MIPTEKEIQNKIFFNIYSRNEKSREFKFSDVCCNIHFFNWESDVLFRDNEFLLWEVEIKRSIEDYEADFEKAKHKLLKDAENNREDIPSYFYFALPAGLVPVDEIPEYAGLYEYKLVDGGLDFNMTKKAPKLTDRRATVYDSLKILRKNNLQYWRKRVGKIPFPR